MSWAAGSAVETQDVIAPADQRDGVGALARVGAITELYRRVCARPPLCVAIGSAGALLLASVAPLWRGAARGTWRVTLPLVPHGGSGLLQALLFLASVAALMIGWIGVVHAARDHTRTAAKRLGLVAIALLAWWIPASLGPPLLSNDVYSYVAQGTLAAEHLDPAHYSPVALGPSLVLSQVDPMWAKAPAPYGPVGIAAAKLAVNLSGGRPARSVWVIRVMAMLAVAIGAIALARLARMLGRDPAAVVAFAVANPIVTVHLVGAGHNDSLVFAFLITGLLAVRRARRVLGAVLLAAALGVKLTAAAGVVAAGWFSHPGDRALWRRASDAAAWLGVCVTLVLLAGHVSGVSLAWIGNLGRTGTVLSTFAPMTLAGLTLGSLVGLANLGVSVLRALGLTAAAAVAIRILVVADRWGAELLAGVLLLLGTVFGPVIWPWYLPAAIALLAVGGALRFTPAAMILIGATMLTVWPTNADLGIPLGPLQPAVQLLGLVGVVLLAIAVQRYAEGHPKGSLVPLRSWARRMRPLAGVLTGPAS